MKNKPIEHDERSLHVFLAFRRRLLGHAGRILRDRAEAEDVVQEAFLRWRDQHASDLRAPEAWLTTVTTRIAIDRMRKNERQALPPSAAPAGEGGDRSEGTLAGDPCRAGDPALLPELADGFRLLFSLLTADERKVLVLREGFEFDFEEIATLTGKSVANCRQIASRARRRLDRDGGEQRLLSADGRELARRCVDAFRVGDSQALMRLLCLHPADSASPMKPGVEMRAAHAPAPASTYSPHVSRMLLQMLAGAAGRIWMGRAVVEDMRCEREEAAIAPAA